MTIRHATAALAVLTLLGTACRPAQETPGTAYGEALSLTDTTQLAAVIENPDAYVGQQLLLTGTVVNVCEKRGCWLELGGELEGRTLRVKVDDGVIVFPMSARGRQAVVEGVMERIESAPASCSSRLPEPPSKVSSLTGRSEFWSMPPT